MQTHQIGNWIAIASLLVTNLASAQSTNEIRISVPGQSMESLAKLKGDEAKLIEFPGVTAMINGDPWMKARIQIRGQSCLNAPRKCLDLKILTDENRPEERKFKFAGDSGLDGKEFNLVSMWQDEGYISSKIGFEAFRALGIFDWRAEYAEVFLNEKSIGLYLVTEKPKKGVRRFMKGESAKNTKAEFFIARRSGGNGALEDKSDFSPESGLSAKTFIYEFANLMAKATAPSTDQKQSEEQLKLLSSRMNARRYMQWLIVNSVLKNGDYTDEVYVFADPSRKPIYFDIYPWDFDDLFKSWHPSSRNEKHREKFKTSLLYSFENPLDVKIGTDRVFYDALVDVAKDVLRQLNDQFIDELIKKVHASIEPYLSNSRALEMSKFDRFGKTLTRGDIEALLKKRAKEIKERRDELKKRLVPPVQ